MERERGKLDPQQGLEESSGNERECKAGISGLLCTDEEPGEILAEDRKESGCHLPDSMLGMADVILSFDQLYNSILKTPFSKQKLNSNWKKFYFYNELLNRMRD